MAVDQSEKYIVLAYRREGNLSTGQLTLSTGEFLEEFKSLNFVQMLTHLARAVGDHPGYGVVFVRLDHTHLTPFKLDSDSVALFKSDPVAAIQSMTMSMPALRARPIAVPVPPLRVGYDTLAASFGEQLFFKLTRSAFIDCPGCAQLGMFRRTPHQIPYAVFKCRNCPDHLDPLVLRVTERWAFMPIERLLVQPLEKFFLPRSWNDGAWITKQDLFDKYQAYLAEKETVCFNPPRPSAPTAC